MGTGGCRGRFHLEVACLTSRGLVSVPHDPQLNDLLWSLLGRGGAFLFSWLDHVLPPWQEELTPDFSFSLQCCLWNLPSLPLPKAIDKGQWALISLGKFGSGNTLSIPEKSTEAHLLRSEWNLEPKQHGCVLGSGLDPGQQYHLGGGFLD